MNCVNYIIRIFPKPCAIHQLMQIKNFTYAQYIIYYAKYPCKENSTKEKTTFH